MPVKFSSVPALTNGVSRQAPALRLDSQAQEQKNMLSGVDDGVSDRPPAELLATTSGTIPTDSFVHGIDRDEGERYLVTIPGDGTLRVFDTADGSEQTVNPIATEAQTYLTCAGDPRKKFRANSVQDNTFLTNREISTAMGSATSQTERNRVLFWVRGTLSTPQNLQFRIYMKHETTGTEWKFAEYISGDGNGEAVNIREAIPSFGVGHDFTVPSLVCIAGPTGDDDSSRYRQQLAWRLSKALKEIISVHTTDGYAADGQSMATWVVEDGGITNASGLEGDQESRSSVVVMESTLASDEDVLFSGEDASNNDFIKVIHRTVDDITDLPKHGAPVGFRVKVSEAANSDEDDWYIEFDGAVWNEAIGFNVPLGFDEDTMPHVLIRESDGTFTFQRNDGTGSSVGYAQRTVGDEDTAPDRGFIGKPIQDIKIFKSRLTFLYDDGVAFSEVNNFLNFWPTTVRQLLDSDPIDIAVDAGSSVARYKEALPYDQALILFSEGSQAVIRGGDIFSAETAFADVATEYEYINSIPPLVTGNTVLFQTPKAQYGSILEYLPDPASDGYLGTDITAHIPRYLPSDITWAAVGHGSNTAIFGSDEDQSRLLVYRYFYDGQQKIQSSWSEFTFGNHLTITGGQFFGTEFFAVGTITTKNLFNQPVLTPAIFRMDFGKEAVTGFEHPIYMDALTSVIITDAEYDIDSNLTMFTLPYQANNSDGLAIVVGEGGGDDIGVIPAELIVFGPAAAFRGSIPNGAKLWIGFPIEREYTPSEYRLRTPSRDNRGVSQPVTNGRVQMKRARVELMNTGYLRAEVYSDGELINEDEFTSRKVGDDLGGPVALIDDDFEVDVGTNTKGLQLKLINDTYLPSTIVGLHYEALYFNRSQRVR